MRKLATAAAVSLALASGGAFGLGLGEIEMRSALNQPMNAEIRLTAVKPGELDGMIVQLASEDAFARAGLERSTVLRDLEFSVDNSGPVPVIRIASERPVVEPFLNFLLEVDWPQGRMVREYTVLLDPPVFMTPSATERNISSDQPALVQRGNEALIVPTPIERAADTTAGVEVDLLSLTPDTSAVADQGEIVSLQPIDDSALLAGEVSIPDDGEIVSLTDLAAPNTAAIEQRESEAQEAFDINSFDVELVGSGTEIGDDFIAGGQAGEVASQSNDASADGSTIVSLDDLGLDEQSTGSNSSAGGDVTVNRGDTLFEIARDNNVSGVSVQQMMMALLAANESAFINNNINLVRAGSDLRIPNSDEASRLTQTQALAAIGQQDQLWQEYRDQLRGNVATQIADSSASGSSLAGVADAPAESIDTASLDEEATDGLSAEARAILDNARSEILNRDELKIVADNAPSSTTASATADETSDNDAERLGALNRRLQLAREELSSTRLQSEDLSEQAGELQSTSDNLDALVSLRQNEVAQLETQLATARAAEEAAATATAAGADALETATDAAGNVADAATDAAGNVADAATDAAGNVADAATDATDAAGNVADAATDAVGNVADGAENLVADASTAISNAAGGLGESADDIVESGTNALTEAGETLSEVELIGDETDSAAVQAEADAAIAPPVKQATWYEDFLSDPKRMMIAGIGGIGLLGVLGTLLFRRKRREDDDDSMLDFDEDVEFIDDNEEADLLAETQSQTQEVNSDVGGFNATGAVKGAAVAGAAAVGGLMATGASAKDDLDDSASLTGAFDDLDDASQDIGSETQAVADATSDDTLDKDDTISEVDVYLAYGLHGQAEELLVKAIDRKPNQPEYAHKLLQTYHAQGNSEGFHKVAEGFHARFGGESNPEWPGIAAMGAELRPGDSLYGAAGLAGIAGVAAIGSGDSDGLKFEADDFLPAQEDGSGSVNRGFGDDQAIDLDSIDETDLLDKSLDPAFAFDEADLEATGDFSEIANEISTEADDGSIEFPDFDDSPDVDMDATLSEVLDDNDSSLGDALTMDELDGLGSSGDDLTLDLDQLSGDLELDTSELLDSDLSDLEIPEFTDNNDFLVSEVSSDANSADEMDTMLDLAKAYIDMGDKDSASSALGEIVKSGSPEQINEAETLLRNIS